MPGVVVRVKEDDDIGKRNVVVDNIGKVDLKCK